MVLSGIRMLSMIGIGTVAAVTDLKTGKIPNRLILLGLVIGCMFQITEKGILGLLVFAGGAGVPILIFGMLYYLRMLGAGDIKLLCTVGGLAGPMGCLHCIFLTIFWGGFLSLGLMLYRKNLVRRMEVFFRYISQYGKGSRETYSKYTQEDAKFCFSVPVLLGILCYAGGIF